MLDVQHSCPNSSPAYIKERLLQKITHASMVITFAFENVAPLKLRALVLSLRNRVISL